MTIEVKTKEGFYPIYIERDGLKKIGERFDLNRKVLVVTDDGVPSEYAQKVMSCAKEAFLWVLPQGETSKSMENLCKLLQYMTEKEFDRSDCVVAVGGGVVGDLSGFVSACFMRGIDFYNVPTTLLSQVDSSVGGKTAVDFCGYKNIIGAFHQPKGVLIDPDTLKTLPQRQVSNGMAEAVKMSLTSDASLFELFEKSDPYKNIDEIIEKSINVKKSVVEEDEQEKNLRKILNFGHTLAHAIESIHKMEDLYHGECVALGMIPMCGASLRKRLIRVLNKLNLPTKLDLSSEKLFEAIHHDKKVFGENISVITVETPGTYLMKNITIKEFEDIIRKGASI